MNVTLNTAKDEIARKIIEIAEDSELTPYFQYSGRGMYGKQCFGVSGSLSKMPQFFFHLGELQTNMDNDENSSNEYDLLMELFGLMQTDSLGLDTIMYFPHLNIFNDIDCEE